MNATMPSAPPRQLLAGLLDAGDRPAVPAAEREAALGWLRRVLVDFTALNQHVALLQQLHGGASFRFPSPRRDGGSGGGPAPDPKFRFAGPWPNEGIEAILDGGVEVLGNDDLGRLLLNPYALSDLHDVISDLGPDAWLPTIQDVGREMMAREGVLPATAPPGVRLPAESSPVEQAPRRAPVWRWAAVSSFATAALMLVVFAGILTRLPNKGDERTDNLVATAKPRFGDRKGAGAALTGLEVASNFDGHVVVVFFEAKEGRPFVIPLSGSEQDWRVKKDGPPTLVVVPGQAEEATAALVIVTETPADAPVRKLLDKQRFAAGKMGDAQALLEAGLRDLDFKRFSIDAMKIARPKSP